MGQVPLYATGKACLLALPASVLPKQGIGEHNYRQLLSRDKVVQPKLQVASNFFASNKYMLFSYRAGMGTNHLITENGRQIRRW